MPDLMASLGNNTADFNKYICSIGTAIFERGEDPVNLLPQLFSTYDDFSSYNLSLTYYIRRFPQENMTKTDIYLG